MDGIVFSKDLGVIMTGHRTDTVRDGITVGHFTRASDQWFYRHIQKKLASDSVASFTLAIPLVDYLFRYDRGAFWRGMWAFKYFLTPCNRITRWLLDPFMRARVMFHALHASGIARQTIVQDIGFPISTAGKFIEYLDESFGFYPLWLCPLRKGHPIPLKPRTGSPIGDKALAEELLLNVGVWGPGPTRQSDFIRINREIEKKTKELFGMKCLYARAYYTEQEFWDVYDEKSYNDLRTKYNATTLPTVYDKVKVDLSDVDKEPTGVWRFWPLNRIPTFWEVWPIAGVYGVLLTTFGMLSPLYREYILSG